MDESPEEPGPFEQATEPAYVRSVSRWDQWMQERAAVGCVVLVAALLVTVGVWGWVAFG